MRTGKGRADWKILSMADVETSDELFDPLRQFGEIVVRPADPSFLRESLGGYDIYVASLKIPIRRELLAGADRLKLIASPSTGSDHLDLDAMEELGIHYISLKGEEEFLSSVTATAEMAWALLLATVRKLPWSFAAAQRGEWARERYRGRQLSGKTLGILGYGRLGRIVAQYGKAFRMRVIACDVRALTPEPGVTMVDFPTLLRESDVLSIHVHLNESTRGMFNGDAFSKMKKEAVLLNTSRGAIVDEAALLAALRTGRIAGAGFDVIDGEWNPDLDRHPLIVHARENENLVVSPHTGGITHESQRMGMDHLVAMLKKFLQEQRGLERKPKRAGSPCASIKI